MLKFIESLLYDKTSGNLLMTNSLYANFAIQTQTMKYLNRCARFVEAGLDSDAAATRL